MLFSFPAAALSCSRIGGPYILTEAIDISQQIAYNQLALMSKKQEIHMEKSKVYFTDFRTGLGVSLPMKLTKLIKKAGIGEINMDGKFVAIKMHFGELGNLAFLRPNYAKAVADVVKEQGGLPS